MTEQVLNPRTLRYITPGKRVYNNLIKAGYIQDRKTNTLLPPTPTNQLIGGGPMGNVSLLDADIPDIGREPLTPTAFQAVRNEIVRNAGKMADWLRKLLQNRRKNFNDLADWILNKKDEIVNRILPSKVTKLIELSKNTTYYQYQYWKINMLSNPEDEKIVQQKLDEDRQKYGKEYDSKYLKMYYYNDIKSLEDVISGFMKTYSKENEAFKLLFSLGYVTEKLEGDDYKIKLYKSE
jgi:hypothetical protein